MGAISGYMGPVRTQSGASPPAFPERVSFRCGHCCVHEAGSLPGTCSEALSAPLPLVSESGSGFWEPAARKGWPAQGGQPALSQLLTAALCSALVFQDLVTMVEQLARFLGVSCDKAQLESLTEHCHQLVDQCCNAEALPVGRGKCPCPPDRRACACFLPHWTFRPSGHSLPFTTAFG